MDFNGPLNFVSPALFDQVDSVVPSITERSNRETLIQDARIQYGVVKPPQDLTEHLTDGIGFLLANAPSDVQNWTDTKEVANHYYEECRQLLMTLMPSATIPEITSHTYRNEDIKEHHWIDGIQYGPCATGVHNDYADFIKDDGTVSKKFSEIMGMSNDKRIIGINIWRSVSEKPLARFPLAVCDRTSIDRDDLEYELNPNAKPGPFNAHFCKPNNDQRWFYYSQMTRDEALVFTTYDSHPTDDPVFCPTLHTAVPIPGSEGRQPRESVEVRFFAQIPL